jgi:predicted house-cleaning NTP pyrophosphatase (Maf/HAM1 superfamily)
MRHFFQFLWEFKMIRLASSSETRAMLLRDAGIPFIQENVEFDDMPRQEKVPGARFSG